MSGHRKAIRAAVRAALANDGRIGGYTYKPAWAFAASAGKLPHWTVAIPSEPVARHDKDTRERRPQIAVILKRTGTSTVEDVLDSDANAIEPVALAAILSVDGVLDAELAGVQFSLTAEGEARIGRVEVTFDVIVLENITSA